MSKIENWPVAVTDRCADACAAALGLAGRREAREWLQDQIDREGELTDSLPEPMTGRRSPSGVFLVVPGVVVLPLAADRDGELTWIATNCLVFPAHRDRVRGVVDPLRLKGKALLAQVELLPHAVARFQQRCGGDADVDRARAEFARRLAPTVRAEARPPQWCGTRPAEFYLVAGTHEEYCLPCRTGGGARPFDVITCIYRAEDLFALRGKELRARCAVGSSDRPASGRQKRLLDAALAADGRLSWQPPRRTRRPRGADWWIVSTSGIGAAVAWQPDRPRTPIRVLTVVDGRPLLRRISERLLGWLR